MNSLISKDLDSESKMKKFKKMKNLSIVIPERHKNLINYVKIIQNISYK